MDDVIARRKLIEASGIEAGRTLDIGMGDCSCMSFMLAAQGFDVIGVDRSSYAIHVARKAARKRRFKGSFEARRADAERLPFEDERFDLVVAYRALHHANNTRRVIREMHRVCRKGGVLLVAELNDHGQKVLEHPSDNGRLIARIGRILTGLCARVKPLETSQNVMFVCHK